MKIRKYILFAVLLLVLPLSIAFNSSAKGGGTVLSETTGRTTILCVGLDEAAGNTDVLMLVTIDPAGKEITVLQIPRDTFLYANTLQGKINQMYPAYRGAGHDHKTALSLLAADISEAFGVEIDHYAAVEFSSIAYLVDRFGGLNVRVPSDILLGDKTIQAGDRLLTGDDALAFIRHRVGYVEGDLGRLDAQKLLLISAYRKLKNDISLGNLLRMMPDFYKQIVTDMSLSRQILLACSYARGRADYIVRLVTLPGAATRADGDEGTWYYIANKKAAGEVLERYFCASHFDVFGRMNDNSRPHIAAIYEDNAVAYTVYTEETIDNLEIKTK